MTAKSAAPASTAPDADALKARGFTVLSDIDVADDDALLRAASRFGHVSTVGNGYPPRPIAEVRPADGPDRAALGSRRAGVFALHTDSTGYPRPHDVVILACVAADEDGGGESLLLPLDDILAAAPAPAVAALASHEFRFQSAVGRDERWLRAPVLERRNQGCRVRYRRDVLGPVPGAAEHALGLWENCIKQTAPRKLLLAPGQALVIDNTRMLHGRTNFSVPTRRHLRRLKLYTDPGREGPAGPPSLW